ncbi:hypothetical protein KEM52_003818 [Ascosphaera acerosa]|nr:hypothetical protein KEM52_003818 [Ascosphaera acerosa]
MSAASLDGDASLSGILTQLSEARPAIAYFEHPADDKYTAAHEPGKVSNSHSLLAYPPARILIRRLPRDNPIMSAGFRSTADATAWPATFDGLLTYPGSRGEHEQKRKHLLRSMKGKRGPTGTRRRAPLACERCRSRKIKCSGENGGKPCTNCRSAGWSCTFKRMGCTEEIQFSIPPAPLFMQSAACPQEISIGYDQSVAMMLQQQQQQLRREQQQRQPQLHPSSMPLWHPSFDSLLAPATRSASPASLEFDNDFLRAPSTAPSSGLGSPRTVHSVPAYGPAGPWLAGKGASRPPLKPETFVYTNDFNFASPPTQTACLDPTSSSPASLPLNSVTAAMDTPSSTAQFDWSNLYFETSPQLVATPITSAGGPMDAVSQQQHQQHQQQQPATARPLPIVNQPAEQAASDATATQPQTPTLMSPFEGYHPSLCGDDMFYILPGGKPAMAATGFASPAQMMPLDDLTADGFTSGLYAPF